MTHPRSYRHVALDPSTSNLTGAVMLVADLEKLTLSIESQTATASRYTVIGTNDDGLQAALGTPTSQAVPTAGWSIVTGITQSGLYNIDPTGFRWINIFRPSASSVTAIFHGRT